MDAGSGNMERGQPKSPRKQADEEAELRHGKRRKGSGSFGLEFRVKAGRGCTGSSMFLNWSGCRWYKTEKDRATALKIFDEKDELFEYRKVER